MQLRIQSSGEGSATHPTSPVSSRWPPDRPVPKGEARSGHPRHLWDPQWSPRVGHGRFLHPTARGNRKISWKGPARIIRAQILTLAQPRESQTCLCRTIPAIPGTGNLPESLDGDTSPVLPRSALGLTHHSLSCLTLSSLLPINPSRSSNSRSPGKRKQRENHSPTQRERSEGGENGSRRKRRFIPQR